MRLVTRAVQKLIYAFTFVLIFYLQLVHISKCEDDTGLDIIKQAIYKASDTDTSAGARNQTGAAEAVDYEKEENSSISPTLADSESAVVFALVFQSISKEERHVYHYHFNESILSKWPAFQIQLYAESEEPLLLETLDQQDPLVVTARWKRGIKSWKIPVTVVNATFRRDSRRYSNNIIGKTVWHDFQQGTTTKNKSSGNLTIEVSSFSDMDLFYKLRIVPIKDFVIRPTASIVVTTTPSFPAIFKLTIPEDWEYAFVHAISISDVCAIMTVQQPRGPFIDMEGQVDKVQLTETFTRKMGLAIKAADYPTGLLLTFAPFANDRKCMKGFWDSTNVIDDMVRKKKITFQVREGPSPVKYVIPVSIPLLAFLLITLFVFFVMAKFHKIRHRAINNEKYTIIIKRRFPKLTTNMTIHELIVTHPSRVVDQSRRYCRAGFVTSAFYSVPVFQLIFTFSRQLKDSGNFDICYFNHFCSHALGIFHDFNHMYSNIWYVLFGLLYMALVRVRQLTSDPDFKNCSSSNSNNTNCGNKEPTVFLFFKRAPERMEMGAMTHHGLLYCTGYAMIMTGVMSSAYHICPNQRNFQFDTVFMYTIAAITVVTLYQARHPTYLSANVTFTALAFVTVITVLGLLWEELYVRVIFSVVHLLFLLLALPKACYNGYIRTSHKLLLHWREVIPILYMKFKEDLRNKRIFKIQRETWTAPEEIFPDTKIIPGPGRVILPGFLLIINCCAITAMWTVLRDQNFATQVLFICVVNGALYTIFYSALKIFYGECRRVLWIQPGFYLLSSFALWGFAMHYFLDHVSSWESSPAVSRIKNRDCGLLLFYDSHDMWHFLSAAALFSSAMVLLTVDDDLVDQPKWTIPVF